MRIPKDNLYKDLYKLMEPHIDQIKSAAALGHMKAADNTADAMFTELHDAIDQWEMDAWDKGYKRGIEYQKEKAV